MSPGYRSLREPARRGSASPPFLALGSWVGISSGRRDLSPVWPSAKEPARRRGRSWFIVDAIAVGPGLEVFALGLDVATLLDLVRIVPWFQRVCGGLLVWTLRLRSKPESGGYLERGGGGGGKGLLYLLFTLLLRLRRRRRKGCSSSSSTETLRCFWLKRRRGGLAEACGVWGSGVKRVAHT